MVKMMTMMIYLEDKEKGYGRRYVITIHRNWQHVKTDCILIV